MPSKEELKKKDQKKIEKILLKKIDKASLEELKQAQIFLEGYESGIQEEREKWKGWLVNLIDTSKICLLDKRPSPEYDKLMFQLESKVKNGK